MIARSVNSSRKWNAIERLYTLRRQAFWRNPRPKKGKKPKRKRALRNPLWWPRLRTWQAHEDTFFEVGALCALQFIPLVEARDIQAGLRDLIARAMG